MLIKEAFMKSKLLKILTSIMFSCLSLFILTACEQQHEHRYTQVVTQPTCEEQGFTTSTCECGDVVVDTYINALGHSFTSYISDNNATCTANGTETAKCDNCIATDIREVQNSKLPHTFENYVSDNNATCDNDGTKTAKCNNCDATDTITDEGTKLIPTDASAFYFDNGTIWGLTDYGYSLSELIIPSEIDGIQVDTIGEWALCGCALTNVVIPDSVNIIGEFAFYDCALLTSVVIGNSVTSIGENAFGYCMSLTSIVIPNSVTIIGTSAFGGCSSLTSVVIPDSVTNIGEGSFENCTSLTNVNLGNGLISIGDYAFDYCIALTKVVIPNSVTTIGYGSFSYTPLTSIQIPQNVTNLGVGAFSSCTSLTSIIVDENNSNYKDVDGNVYSKDGTILLQYAIGKTDTSFIIPDNVTSIGDFAFRGCSSLTNIEILSSVTNLGDSAFNGCSSLTSVLIPNSVINMGNGVFSNCRLLSEIKYRGTVEEWSAINKDYNWCYNSMATKITCTDGETCIEHSFTNYVSDNNATCMANGTKTSKCDNCDIVDIIEDAYSKLPHSFTNYVSDNNATYDNDGTKTAKCDNCNTTDTITDEGSKLVSTEYIFTFDNGTITGLTEYGKTLTEIVIPKSIDEIVITSIGYRAFSNFTSLTSVTIENGVQSIGSAAFSGCSSLTTVIIPDSVTSIDNSAFEDCTSLTSVIIGNGVTYIGNSAFGGCTSLSYNVQDNLMYMGNQSNPYLYLIGVTSTSIKTAIINDNCIVICDSAFDKCFSLNSIVISDRITSIGSAFDSCISLNSITIGSNVTNISPWVFEDTWGLVEVINKSPYITIEKGSSTNGGVGYYALSVSNCDDSYVSKLSTDSNGYIIYTDDSDKILVGYVGEQTELILPNDITRIHYASFMLDNITSVVIPNNVKSIGTYAFGNCTSLTSIVIPSSVTSVGDMAFANCTSLTIYCEAGSKPSGWDTYWDFCNTYYIIPIVWGYKG